MKKIKNFMAGMLGIIILFGNCMSVGATFNNGAFDSNDEMILGAPENAEIHVVDDSQVISENTRMDDGEIAPYASYTASFGDFCYIEQESWMDFGIYYTTNDSNIKFRWLEYNVSTETWKVIQSWSSSNWVSWKTSYGSYWLQCEMKTSDNKVQTKTITYNYVAGKTKLTGTNISKKADGDETYLLGCVSENKKGVKYSILIYDLKTATWKSLVYKGATNWIDWGPETGDYWVQFEVYTSDGRLGDIRTHEVSARRPIRRAIIIGCSSGVDDNTRFKNNVNGFFSTFSLAKFHGTGFSKLNKVLNTTKANVISKIKETLSDAKEGDISYLIITAHGSENGNLSIGTDLSISPTELKQLLDKNVKGTVVLLVTGCYSGYLIQKSSNSTETGQEWAENFISAFKESAIPYSGEFATSKYKVLCASQKDEVSYASEERNYAALYWMLGMGWDMDHHIETTMGADDNSNNKVTLNELYAYSYVELMKNKIGNLPAVYPQNSDFVIYGKY